MEAEETDGGRGQKEGKERSKWTRRRTAGATGAPSSRGNRGASVETELAGGCRNGGGEGKAMPAV